MTHAEMGLLDALRVLIGVLVAGKVADLSTIDEDLAAAQEKNAKNGWHEAAAVLALLRASTSKENQAALAQMRQLSESPPQGQV